jgi:uncharacterized delta-60 repeat protein
MSKTFTRAMLVVAAALTMLAAAGGATGQGAPQDDRPVRFWSFGEFRANEPSLNVAGGVQQGGLLEEFFDHGPLTFDVPPDFDGIATSRISSAASGKTFEVFGQAPIGDRSTDGSTLGGFAALEQDQAFEKQRGDATHEIVISKALMHAIDNNGALLPGECVPDLGCSLLQATVEFDARAYTADGHFFETAGVARLKGHSTDLQGRAFTSVGSPSPLWDDDNFVQPDTPLGTAFFELAQPVRMNLDISSLDDGELYGVHVFMRASALDLRGRESAVEAFIRDPQRRLGLHQTSGVRPRGEPPFPEPPLEPPVAASCPGGPDPAGGTLQFEAADYAVGEWPGAQPEVVVTRTGGSTGAVSAELTTSAGSAEAGVDYTEVSTIVTFADGDASPRLAEVPILHDLDAESAETVNVTLSNPQCAELGEQDEAALTIIDDDTVVEPESFTVGGTVSGLEGSGLVLSDLGPPFAIDANGPFESPIARADGAPYDVQVVSQPTSPDQVCVVVNGTGQVDGADVTDILVDCVTPLPPAGLDPDFGVAGKVSGPVGEAEAVAIQADGAIVTAGTRTGNFQVARHLANGDPDGGFGGGTGVVTTSFNGTDEGLDVAIDSDDRIVVVGSAAINVGTNFTDFGVVRYLPDGTPDPDFGVGGKVTTDFGVDISGDGLPESGADVANAVAIQPDGKIVVAGHAHVPRGVGLGFQNDFAVARYLADGTPDPDFGVGGKVTTTLSSETDLGQDVVVQPDGRIVVGGDTNNGDDFALVRYEPDGRSLDGSFDGGIVVSDFGGGESIKGLALQPDGRIVAAGSSTAHGDTFDFAVTRYEANGTLDPVFGGALSDHLVTTDTSGDIAFGHDFAADVTLQADGRIVLVGRNTSDTFSDFTLTRYATDGTLDEAFGTDGILSTDFHGSGEFGADVAVQPDGKIVAAGQTTNGFTSEFALLRILP